MNFIQQTSLFLSFALTSLGFAACSAETVEFQPNNLSNNRQITANNNTKICTEAIASVENQLNANPQVTIKNSQILENDYLDRPQGRPNIYELTLGGNAANSLMNTDTLVNSLATEIINGCDSISLVRFHLEKTHYVLDYGLMSNGKVKKFQCPPDYRIEEPYRRPLEWGERCDP